MKKEVPRELSYRLINPGCLVLLTAAHKDRSNIMTLAWLTPLTMKPPLVGISVALGHFTNELIRAGGDFALNIPGRDLLSAVLLCGKLSGRSHDKFKEAGLTTFKAAKVKAPLVEECLAYLECGVVNRHNLGDHSFFVGEVLAAGVEEDLFSDRWEDKPQASTIHHLGSDWFYFSGSHRQGGQTD